DPEDVRAGRRFSRSPLADPAADAAVEFAERPGKRGRAAPRRLVRPRRHLRVFGGVPHAAGFQHPDVSPRLTEHLRGHAAAGPGSDNAHVVGFRLTDYLHSGTGYDKKAIL